ncbi:MAG: DUF3086 domain-containing protein [Leptolyngbyaceae cyanobacterium HOT.MB2.61]|nr:DUF3086 domain-containing protein [Leptolyngbyaceae cyanobacterium HOT.MB2.61]
MNPDESKVSQPDEPEEQSTKSLQPSEWDQPSTATEPEDPWLESLGENESASSEPVPPTTDGEELPLLVLPKIERNPVEPLPKSPSILSEEPLSPSFTIPAPNPAIAPQESTSSAQVNELEQRIAELQRQERSLKQEIEALEATHAQLRGQIAEAQGSLGRLVQEGLKELEQRKQALQISVEQLERRQERIRAEMKTTFAGVSQDLAIRVQSFKDYLVGSLQDLALAAEQLELPKPSKQPSRPAAASDNETPQTSPTPKFAEQSFQEQTRKIRNLLDQYRNRPDYYGPPWHLRRTFEPIHAERVSNWFFTQGGRGAIRTMGSRLQNILVASATISILHTLYGDRLRALILAESPERLGEWRRGLQDCLGITRSDFGPERGVALFEDPELMAQKADRSLKDGLLPFIIMDETEEQISLSILQFPLWLAFAPNPQASSPYPREW